MVCLNLRRSRHPYVWRPDVKWFYRLTEMSLTEGRRNSQQVLRLRGCTIEQLIGSPFTPNFLLSQTTAAKGGWGKKINEICAGSMDKWWRLWFGQASGCGKKLRQHFTTANVQRNTKRLTRVGVHNLLQTPGHQFEGRNSGCGHAQRQRQCAGCGDTNTGARKAARAGQHNYALDSRQRTSRRVHRLIDHWDEAFRMPTGYGLMALGMNTLAIAKRHRTAPKSGVQRQYHRLCLWALRSFILLDPASFLKRQARQTREQFIPGSIAQRTKEIGFDC